MPTLADLHPELFGTPARTQAQHSPGFFSQAKSGLATLPIGVGQTIEDLGVEQDYPSLERTGRGLRRWGESVQQANPPAVRSMSDFVESPFLGVREFAGQAVGTSAATILPYFIPGVGPVAGTAAGLGMGALQSYGGIRAMQRETGEESLPLAAGTALASGAIEQLGGAQRMFRPRPGAARVGGLMTREELGQMSSSPWATMASRMARVGGEEGLEELAQNPIEQYGGGYNPADRVDDTLFGGFQGAVGAAATFGLGSGIRRGLQHRSAQDYIAATLNNPDAPTADRLDAVFMQQQFMGGGQEAEQWGEQMRAVIQTDADRMRAAELASGAPFDLLNLQRDLTVAPEPPAAQTASIFDTINANQGALQGLPHAAAGSAMPVGTPVEDPLNRAAGIYATLAGRAPAGTQEEQDLVWAEQQLQRAMSPEAFAAFAGQVALERGASSKPAVAKTPQFSQQASPTARATQPGAPATQTLGQVFKSFGGRVSNVVDALDQARSPEEAIDVVRQWLEKPTIAQSTHNALAEMHKHLTGKTYEQHLHEQEAAAAAAQTGAPNVRQGVDSQALPSRDGQAQGTQPGTAVQPFGAEGQRPAQQGGERQRQAVVSDPARRARLAQQVISELRPEDQEVLGFLQLHGEKAFEPLAQKLGISRQAARQRIYGVRDREGNVRQLGIIDRIANKFAARGLTMEDVLRAYQPRVYEPTEARTGLSPKVNESVYEDAAVHQEESTATQESGTIASAGGSQSNWKDGNSKSEQWLRENDPEYREEPVAEEPDQELIPAAQGEKADERIEGREQFERDYAEAERQAEAAWESIREGDDQVLAYADLPEPLKERVIEETAQRPLTIKFQNQIMEEFRDPTMYSKGKPFNDEQRSHAGIQRALRELVEARLLPLLDFVKSGIRAVPGLPGWGGVRRFGPGDYGIVLKAELLEKPGESAVRYVAHTFRHEVAHVEDIELAGYSQGDAFAALRPVVDQLAMRKWGGGYLNYPYNQMEQMDELAFSAEVYAQLRALWLDGDVGGSGQRGRDIIQYAAPEVAAFMREVDADVQTFLKGKPGEAPRTAEGNDLRGSAARVQALRARAEEPLYHRAFHGTAANVHENGGFTTQKIGTGEGAQAYGWGLYFSSLKEIARWYRDRLTEKVRLVFADGANAPRSTVAEKLAYRYLISRYDNIDAAILHAHRNAQVIRNPAGGFNVYWDDIEKVYERWKKLGVRKEYNDGRVYEVELAPQLDEYLDWDKPLSEQSEKVKTAIRNAFGEIPNLARALRDGSWTGRRFYQWLNGDPEAASRRLFAAGIPGIKYQGRTSNEQNFVIFDDSLVKITSFENRGKPFESTAAKTDFEEGDVVTFKLPWVEGNGAVVTGRVKDTVEVDEHGRVTDDGTGSPRIRVSYTVDGETITNTFSPSVLRKQLIESHGNTPYMLQNRGKPFELPRSVQTQTMTRLGDVWAKVKPTILTLHQLADQYGDKLKTLREYVLSLAKMEQRHHEVLNRAHKVILDWQKLPTRIRTQLDSVMYRTTLRGVHPDEPFGTGLNDHLTDREEYDAIKASYDVLPENAKAMYKAVRKLLDENWDARKAAFARSTTAAYQKLIDNAADDQKRVAELTAERDRLIRDHEKAIKDIKGPYFPLLRFGDYLTIAKSKEYVEVEKQLEKVTGSERTALQKRLDAMKRQGAHYVVEAHENRYTAETSAAQYTARGMVGKAQLAEEHLRALQPLAAGAIDKISSTLTDQFDRETAGKMKQLITELYISSLPEHAALQRQLKRKGVEGATQDMLRAVAKGVEKDAFYLARLEFSDEIADNLFKVKMEAKQAGIDYQHVYNNLAARLALDFDWKPQPVQQAMAWLSSIWHLGMSPAYLLVNATQPWMITAPVLAGRFGAGRTFSALRSAWVDAASMIVAKPGGLLADIDFKTVRNPEERAMLERIVQHGQIDITQNVDMGLVADGMDPKFLKAQKVFNWANQHVEVSNRLTTALASYRLARQRGMSHDDATDFAYKAVVDTQLDYSNANAAYWMKTGAVPLGKLIFQFRKYQQGMLYLMARNAQLAFKGDKDALRTLGYLAAMQLAFAGAVGIPVVTAPLAAVGLFLGGGDDEKGDAETQLRNYLADLMGPDAARAFWKGLPTLLGLDVSKRVGMGELWDPLPYLRLTGRTGAEDMGQLLVQTLGAPFGMVSRWWDSTKFFGRGDWAKGIERLMPKMLADPLKAARYADEGMTSRTGTQLIAPDKIDGWDIAFRAVGFSPVVESEHYEAKASKEKVSRAIKERRDAILAQYANARQQGKDARSALEAIEEFNRDHPAKGIRIDRSAMLRAVQSRRKGASETDAAGVRFAKREQALRGIDRYAY